jgi:hypothetical protein
MPNREGKLVQKSRTFKIPITPRTLPRLIKAGLALRKGFRGQDLDAERPEFVMHDEKSRAILDLAQDLAADEREDDDAVAEIRKLAGRNQFALRLAALGARQWGQHREATIPNLAHRLLQAAITGKPVAQLTRDERERLQELDDFAELDRDEAWRTLVDREPRLRELDDEAKAGDFGGPLTRWDETLPRLEQQQIARKRLEGMQRLNERVEPLLGPESGSEDTLLRTHIALEAARMHLLR